MTTPRDPWNIRPARTRAAAPAALKTEVEAKARALIETVLKPRHVLPPPTDGLFNSITDIGAKWYRNSFDFYSTYVCPSPTALAPSIESMFARMEPLGHGTVTVHALASRA